MNKKTISALLLLPVLTASSQAATTTYNDTITAIFGSGNPDGGWVSTVDNNIELGLRAKNRTTGATTNDGAGTYSFATGFANPPTNSRAVWNFEFSLNSDESAGTTPLSAYRFVLSYDVNPSTGQTWMTMEPLIGLTDNSFGNDSTPNGGGVEPANAAEYSAFPSLYNIAQNSGNIMFATTYPGFPSPTLDATYDFRLTAYSSTDTAGLAPLAETSMRVVVGAGGARVPDSGSTLLMLGSTLLGMVGYSKVRKSKRAATA